MPFPIARVLLTNDDGIDAPGLAVLEEVAAAIAAEVWVVAPEHDQSGTSHSVSLHHPLRMRPRGPRRFAVGGTPGDCVAMGLRHLLRETPPELVLSGVNRGGNIGMETVFSGTVGAAMTAILLGVPAIALSQTFRDRDNVPWDTARALAPDVRVNAVAPGLVATPWTEPWSEERKASTVGRTMLGRMARPEDIAEPIFFLSAGAAYITGEKITVDGGAI